MATLTVAEIDDIRLVIGDAGTTEVLSDLVIQAQYDIATTNAPVTGLILPYTYVYTLERLLGGLRVLVDRTTDHGDHEKWSQKFEQTEKLLERYEKRAGLTGGVLTTGVLGLAIDTTQEWLDEQEALDD